MANLIPTQIQPGSTSVLSKRLQTRRPLQIFTGYRLLLATFLAGLFFSGSGPSIFGSHDPQLFAIAALLYLILVIISGLMIDHISNPSHQYQAFLIVFVDICILTLMMHSSGGVKTGLGMLIGVSIVAGSLITQGRWAGLLAALASLAILTEQVYSSYILGMTPTYYTQSGLLGGSFFAIALLSRAFSIQIQKSEALVIEAESNLLSMEQLNDYIIQHMQTGIMVIDTDGNTRLMNQAAWYLLGMPGQSTGQHLSEICHELERQLETRGLDYNKESAPFKPTPDGRELTAGFSGLGPDGKNGIVIFLEDAATVAQQAQQMKLASLGRLTASIAHEIRNPLGAISHAEQLLRESPDLPSGDQRLIGIINTNVIRVNEVIETILSLSRRNRSHPEEFLLKLWLETLVSGFKKSEAFDELTISIQVSPDETLVRADQSQLKQVFSILCDNAIKHFKNHSNYLEIRFDGGITRESGSPFIDIIDNGPGIDDTAKKQIFEPFFTTENSGTGLGLYIAKELCESNKLGLEYISRPTVGSCFRISFPGRGNKPISS